MKLKTLASFRLNTYKIAIPNNIIDSKPRNLKHANYHYFKKIPQNYDLDKNVKETCLVMNI